MNRQRPRTDEGGYLTTASLPVGLYRVWLLSGPSPPVEMGVLPVPASGEVTLHMPAP